MELAAAGCVGRVARAVPWNAVAGCEDGRRECRACGVFGAVSWELLLGAPRGCRCAMGIATGRVARVLLPRRAQLPSITFSWLVGSG